jgi:hypothetical protein
VVAQHVVREDGSSFASPLEAHIEFRRSFRERSCLKVCPPKIEMSKPRIAELLRALKNTHRFANIPLFELRLAENQFRLDLRLGFQALPKRTGDYQRAWFLPCGLIDLRKANPRINCTNVGC